MKTVVIVQARMTSSRFPGKSMEMLGDKSVVQHVLERCISIRADDVVLAVPDDPASDPMQEVAYALGLPMYYGPENDVLGRFSLAAQAYEADVVMRITADCPFIHPELCRVVLNACRIRGLDYISNVWPNRTFPKGMDCEAFTIGALLAEDGSTSDPVDREHVTPWMQRQPWARKGIEASELNLCVDTPQDLTRLRRIA